MAHKILLDTDIGYDIDDALCLAYLLAQPACDLLGITTVTGQAEERAMIASAICQAAGRDIPIFPGADDPLLIPQEQTVAPQAQALSHLAHRLYFPRGEAIEFMRQTIRLHPGEVTLLAIGPLTNVALLFATDPQIPLLLKQLVLMCGVFNPRTHYAEWNARLDPHATAMVYRAPVAVHRSVGLDVTGQVILSAAQIRQRFRHGFLPAVLQFAEVYFTHKDRAVFHDPLAAVSIFDESICTFERGNVDIELENADLRGRTHWQPDRFGTHEVAFRVNSNQFFQHYFDILG
jgi:inosine-uridine nucleoside N-ribohydrolase